MAKYVGEEEAKRYGLIRTSMCFLLSFLLEIEIVSEIF